MIKILLPFSFQLWEVEVIYHIYLPGKTLNQSSKGKITYFKHKYFRSLCFAAITPLLNKIFLDVVCSV